MSVAFAVTNICSLMFNCCVLQSAELNESALKGRALASIVKAGVARKHGRQ